MHEFVAKGDENELIIGSFEYNLTPGSPLPPLPPCTGTQDHTAYYYIDDVVLFEFCELDCDYISTQIEQNIDVVRGPNGRCCYELSLTNTGECLYKPSTTHVAYFNGPTRNFSFTPATNWETFATLGGTRSGYAVTYEGTYWLQPGETVALGTVCMNNPGDELDPSFNFGFVYYDENTVGDFCGGPITIPECPDCCDDLTLQLLHPENPTVGRCEWDIKLTQNPTQECIYGVQISGINVTSQTSTGTTPLDFSNGLVVGSGYLTMPPTSNGIVLATVTVQLLDADGNVVCTLTRDVTCSNPDEFFD